MKRTKNEKTFLINFGKKMKRYKEQNGWTLEYCEEIGWPSWQHLQKIEAGKNIIPTQVTCAASHIGFGSDDED